MMTPTPTPLTAGGVAIPTSASNLYRQQVEQRRLACLTEIQRLPIAVLIWGPAPIAGNPMGMVRQQLKTTLDSLNHVTNFSEDLYDRSIPHSLVAQQTTHVESHDITFSLPDSPGSIAEIHDFMRMPGVSHKIIAFLDRQWNSGYANQSIQELQANITCKIQLYDSSQLPGCVIDEAVRMVAVLQEIHYLNGRRP